MKLDRLRIEKGEDLVEYLNIFNEILDQLKKIDEKDKTTLLLMLLANYYDNFMEMILFENDINFLE